MKISRKSIFYKLTYLLTKNILVGFGGVVVLVILIMLMSFCDIFVFLSRGRSLWYGIYKCHKNKDYKSDDLSEPVPYFVYRGVSVWLIAFGMMIFAWIAKRSLWWWLSILQGNRLAVEAFVGKFFGFCLLAISVSSVLWLVWTSKRRQNLWASFRHRAVIIKLSFKSHWESLKNEYWPILKLWVKAVREKTCFEIEYIDD